MSEPWRVIRQLRVLAFETIRLHEEKCGENAWRDEADQWLKDRWSRALARAMNCVGVGRFLWHGVA